MTDHPTELVPLALVAAEVGQTVEDLAHRLEGDVLRDDVQLRCISVEVARRVIEDRDRHLEEARLRRERNAATKARPVPRGIPAIGDLSAYESMIAVDQADPDNIWLDHADEGATFRVPAE